jgi:hypothetical protein
MNIDDGDLTPAGASLRTTIRPDASAAPVATFTRTRAVHPDELWQPLTRTTETTRDGQQGSPFGRPGHGLEHEPLDQDERDSERVTRNAFDYVKTSSTIRAALRPGGF